VAKLTPAAPTAQLRQGLELQARAGVDCTTYSQGLWSRGLRWSSPQTLRVVSALRDPTDSQH